MNKSNSVAYHLPGDRPEKTRCGMDRDTPLGSLKMADHSHSATCRNCLRLHYAGRNNRKRGGDWLRG